MRKISLCCFRRTLVYFLLAAFALMMTGPAIMANSVTTISGGLLPNYYGYSDGNTFNQAKYHTPTALAMDSSGNYLYVADRDNDVIRYLDLVNNYTWTYATNLVSKPVGVAVDVNNLVYVLNRGNGTNGSVIVFNPYDDSVSIIVSKLTNAAAMTMDPSGNIYLTMQSNKLVRIAAGTFNMTTLATINITGASLQGIIYKHNGLIAACDSGRNGIYLIDPTTGIFTTNAGFNGTGDFLTNGTDKAVSSQAKFNQPVGIAEAGDGSLLVTDYGNNRVKVVATSGVVSNLYGVTSQFWNSSYFPGWSDGTSSDHTVKIPDQLTPNIHSRMPYGIVFALDGSVYTSEDYYHLIRKTTAAGLVLPPPLVPNPPASLTATPGYGQILITWATSTGATNYNVKRSTSSGTETTLANFTAGAGSSMQYADTNVVDGTAYYYVVSALNTSGESMNSPEAHATPLFSPTPTNLVVTATNFNTISLSWSPSPGATSYNIKRAPSTGGPYALIHNGTQTSFTDTTVQNGVAYYYVVAAVNSGGSSTNSLEVKATAPLPPPPPPRIGWFDYEGNNQFGFFTKLHPISIFTFNNDQMIAVDPNTNGVSTLYTAGPSPWPYLPAVTNGTTPPFYQDNVGFAQPLSVNTVPDLIIRAVNIDAIGQSSAVTSAEFIFQVGSPSVNGLNAAQFTVSDITSNTVFWYTIDGTDPTNAPPSLGPLITDTNGDPVSLSFNVTTNLLFKVRGFRNGYYPSGIALQSFSPGNFNPNTISFGFASGEASSDFIASAGQTFYAPITLTMISNSPLYSLQFNLSVTNAGPNPGPAVTPGAYGFNSFLEEPIPNTNPKVYEYIPPLVFNPNSILINPPPQSQLVTYNGALGITNFVNLLTTNLSQNLLSIGWLERFGQKNLFDTTAQNLITYSEAHDVQYPINGGGQVEVGGYSFQVPLTATNGQTYQINIGRPSATSDGIGAPGSDVFIQAPNNGNFYGGAPVNSVKYVTVGQRKYVVGSVYPFRWFNAGDFGGSNIVSADVAQVFQAAIYNLDTPPPGSDFFDAMDSCGSYLAFYDGDTGHYTNDTSQIGHGNPLFDGNDTNSINHLAYGDGALDICDIYVTFRRSLDTNSLTWFKRYWSNGQRVADALVPGASPNLLVKAAIRNSSTPLQPNAQVTAAPQVNFAAGDVTGFPGQTVVVPITATIVGTSPLRLLALNLTVTPLDGSPALTSQISFSQTASTLGSPYIVKSISKGNFAATWLNNTNAGLTGTVTIGNVFVTLPSNATTNSSYAVHFDHASASPNGFASFPANKLTGIIAGSARTNSLFNDGIPDSWRLRWFGTIYNSLSMSNADACGDGINNWKKFIAGVDPTIPNSFPKVNPKSSVPSGYNAAIHWPTVSGKQYVIERSASLFPGVWSTISTNTGNGTDMEYDDNNTNKLKFYRVRILP